MKKYSLVFLKLEKEGIKTPYTDVVEWFENNFIELNYTDIDTEFYANLNTVTPLLAVIEKYASKLNKEDQAFCMELVLWGLTINNKLDKSENDTAYKFESAGIGQHFYGNN